MGGHDLISKRSSGCQGLPAPPVATIAEMLSDDTMPTLDPDLPGVGMRTGVIDAGDAVHALERLGGLARKLILGGGRLNRKAGRGDNGGIMALNSHLPLVNPYASSGSSALGMTAFQVPSL